MQDACKIEKLINNNNIRKIPLINNTYLATTTATIFTLTVIFALTTTTLVSASTTVNSTTTNTTSVGEEQEAESSMTTTTNNTSNALLGRLFSYDEGKDVESNVNPVNETYIVISYSGNRIILPPNATGIINATETGNVTINTQPNGISFNQGHAVIMTEGGTEGGSENATISFVLLTHANPDGSGSGTSVTYFSTNSTGQLAFLDNLVAIGQVEYSPDEGINRFAEWEWKGGTIPFENLIPQP